MEKTRDEQDQIDFAAGRSRADRVEANREADVTAAGRRESYADLPKADTLNREPFSDAPFRPPVSTYSPPVAPRGTSRVEDLEAQLKSKDVEIEHWRGEVNRLTHDKPVPVKPLPDEIFIFGKLDIAKLSREYPDGVDCTSVHQAPCALAGKPGGIRNPEIDFVSSLDFVRSRV